MIYAIKLAASAVGLGYQAYTFIVLVLMKTYEEPLSGPDVGE